MPQMRLSVPLPRLRGDARVCANENRFATMLNRMGDEASSDGNSAQANVTNGGQANDMAGARCKLVISPTAQFRPF